MVYFVLLIFIAVQLLLKCCLKILLHRKMNQLHL